MNKSTEKSAIALQEEKILAQWQEKDIFQKTLDKLSPKGNFVFYDGPPFATGTPHYGHIVASLMKDVIPRYRTMQGYHVERKWGWDTHGLPVENLIEQELGYKDKKEIEQDVAKFNEACRASVLRYAEVWRKFIPRIGRWVDMDNAYLTMQPEYMESVWWVFKQLFDKGLIYEGYKAMHICPRCQTTLSNFEVTQNYQEIKDLSATLKFKLDPDQKIGDFITDDNTYILAWTTTPWTLAGNVALAVGRDIIYVKVRQQQEYFVLAKERLSQYLPQAEIVQEFTGKALAGKKYQPLFDYYQNIELKNQKNGWQIHTADFVSTMEGTGVVHIAPAFGEDDLNLGQQENLPFIQHVDMAGKFKSEVTDWSGELVKPKGCVQRADKEVIAKLQQAGKIFSQEEYSHTYPLCWRCDTPLLNYATSSWFVKVTAIKDKLIKNNQKINWIPSHLKAGRFGKWLEEAKDWAISRSRFWGAPLPVWRCQNSDCQQITVVSSKAELEKLSGQKVTDLHKHFIDKIQISCVKCGGQMQRIPEVLDCWFESGSMPYSQEHFPFKEGDQEKNGPSTLPAEFIAEGVDQTRGWFYNLLVLSTALYNQPTYLNVIANGIVLAEDGAKMSKRLKNYPEPQEVVEQYGADALRYYLLTSPVMQAESLNFDEKGVKESLQKVIMLTENIVGFYSLYAGQKIVSEISANVLDQWILAKLNLLIKEVGENLEQYLIVKATRPLADFVNDLSTWWLRRSRDRFKGEEVIRQEALATLQAVLLTLSKVMAPALPFLAERIYQAVAGAKESVHLEDWPKVEKKFIDEELLAEMSQARVDVEKGLALRAEAKIKVRQPLAAFHTPSKYGHPGILQIMAAELNVKAVHIDKEYWLNTEIDQELKQQGLLRELIRQINTLRKEQKLTIKDQVRIYWQSDSQELRNLLRNSELAKSLATAVLAKEIKEQDNDGAELKVNELSVKMKLEKV